MFLYCCLQNQLLNIARLQAAELNSRLAPKNITLHITDAALQHAVHQATAASGTVYGARPLRRWLEQHIITDLSRLIVSGELPDSSDVYCDVAPGVAEHYRAPRSPSHGSHENSEDEGVLVKRPALDSPKIQSRTSEAGVQHVHGSTSQSGFTYTVQLKPDAMSAEAAFGDEFRAARMDTNVTADLDIDMDD